MRENGSGSQPASTKHYHLMPRLRTQTAMSPLPTRPLWCFVKCKGEHPVHLHLPSQLRDLNIETECCSRAWQLPPISQAFPSHLTFSNVRSWNVILYQASCKFYFIPPCCRSLARSPIERCHGGTDFCVVKYTKKPPPSGAQKMKISNCTKDGPKHLSPKGLFKMFCRWNVHSWEATGCHSGQEP